MKGSSATLEEALRKPCTSLVVVEDCGAGNHAQWSTTVGCGWSKLGRVSKGPIRGKVQVDGAAALTGLTAMAEDANEIDLVWNSTNSGVGTVVTEYGIYRSTTSTFTPSTSNEIGTTKSNWFQDELASASTQYYYQILAKNSLGVSPASATASAPTPALNPNLWGGAPFFDGSGIPATPDGDTLMV